MFLNIILCCIGFLLLYYGAEWLVKGSSSLARSLGVSPLVIGLTIVAFGTSTPELVVSVIASIGGKSMIAVGNVVGSNICNIALVLGVAALFQPIRSDKSVIRRDIPIMLGVSLYLAVLSLNSVIGRIEGATLFAGVIVYTWLNYVTARNSPSPDSKEPISRISSSRTGILPVRTRWKYILFVVAGIAFVVEGAELVVDSAVKIMTVFGVSEKFIGLTVVAFGTSLPELATSVVAAVRKEMDISIGNLVGSNVFNIMSVIGIAAMIKPIPIPGGFFESGLVIDYAVMMFTSFLPWLLMRKTAVLSRKGGLLLLLSYIGYLIYLFLRM